MVPSVCSLLSIHWCLIVSEELWRAVTSEADCQAVYLQMLEQMLMACSRP